MRRSPTAALATALVALVLAGASPAAATETLVTTETEYRAAITALSGDDSGPHTITLGADITVTGGSDPAYDGAQPLTIDGDGHTLSGGDTRRVLGGASASPLLTLTDVTVRDGFATGSGGAVYWPGAVTMDGVHLLDNTATATAATGGGVRAEGTVNITDSVLRDNQAIATSGLAQGGAVTTSNGVFDMTVTRTTVIDNGTVATTISSGGALRTQGDITLTDVVAIGNSIQTGSSTANGGFASASGGIDMVRGHVHGNEAVSAESAVNGAGLTGFVHVTAEDSFISGNRGEGTAVRGTAINAGSTNPVTLTNTTVAGNVSAGAGGEAVIWTGGTVTGDHATIVDNTGTVSANVRADTLSGRGFVIGRPVDGPNCSVGNGAASHSIDDDGTCRLTTGVGNASNVADIGLGPLRPNGDLLSDLTLEAAEPAWTMFPLAGSPAVDRVPTGECTVDHDQRGVGRPFGAGCDAGAVEAVYPPHAFTDVPPWVEDAVAWMGSDVNDPQLMTGITPTTFEPDDPITRAQVVRVLYREAGSPDVSGYPAHGFTDVPAWVEDAVRWAKGEDIATGITPTTFVPNDPITRAQVTRMKYRFAGSPDVSGYPAHPFTDVPNWVQDAVRWAANTDNPLPLVTGITPTTFRPDDDITRAQVARMDYRLALTPAAWADPEGAPRTMLFQAPRGPT